TCGHECFKPSINSAHKSGLFFIFIFPPPLGIDTPLNGREKKKAANNRDLECALYMKNLAE
ncbi:hypothetical protein, partial [Photorhabdus kayaii]|uniref:hypothetical protein n=1 Tax=Photorhabdus kayaii TaxID=230088 RepID=UPI0021D4E1CD